MGCIGSRENPVGDFSVANTQQQASQNVNQRSQAATTTRNMNSNARTVTSNAQISTRGKPPSPLPPQHSFKNDVVYLKAIFDFQGRAEEDLTFMKGDKLILKDSTDENWWFCQNTRTGAEGYAPTNHVAKEQSTELEEWFFGDIRRMEAENLLLTDGKKGVFLVRRGETNTKTYSLSVCDGSAEIKHYRIKVMDNGSYYVSVKACFNDITSMIQYYKSNADGLCCMLLGPPLKSTPDTVGLSKNTWEEPRKNFKLTRKLGAGNFGEVWEALHKGSVLVAIKTLKPGTMATSEFLEEANIMKRMKHPNLVQLLAVCTEEEPLYIVTEYMKNGSLLDLLRSRKRQMDLRITLDMCIQIAQGMKYLEDNKIIHRDLAARNILVSHDYKYKVADFGLTRAATDDVYEGSNQSKFPIKWTAPEAITHKIFTSKSDVWSFGILVYEIVTDCAQPYEGMTNQETVNYITDGNRMRKPKNCDKELYNLMLQCWLEDPSRRPAFQTIVNFLEDYDTRSGRRYLDDPSNRKA